MKKKKEGQVAHYFTAETDHSIKRFIDSADLEEKKKIFDKEIRHAFEKLIENLIFVYKFHKIDDVSTLKGECLTFLYESLPKFDPSMGTKGFSYFNVIAKNWFLHRIKEKRNKDISESDLQYDLDHEATKSDPGLIVAGHEEVLQKQEWWLKFYEQMDSWRDRLSKPQDMKVLEAVIFIMKNSDLVHLHNKKAVYLYIKEMTDFNTKQVVSSLGRITSLYEEWSKKYRSTGESGDGREEFGRRGQGKRQKGQASA